MKKKIQRANKADTVLVVDKMQYETKCIIKSASNEKRKGKIKKIEAEISRNW